MGLSGRHRHQRDRYLLRQVVRPQKRDGGCRPSPRHRRHFQRQRRSARHLRRPREEKNALLWSSDPNALLGPGLRIPCILLHQCKSSLYRTCMSSATPHTSTFTYHAVPVGTVKATGRAARGLTGPLPLPAPFLCHYEVPKRLT